MCDYSAVVYVVFVPYICCSILLKPEMESGETSPFSIPSSIPSVLSPGDISVCSSAKSVGRTLPRLLLILVARSVVVAFDEAPYGLEVSLVRPLEHDQIVPHLVDGIWESRLLAEVYQEDGEAVELEADLAHIIWCGIGDV